MLIDGEKFLKDLKKDLSSNAREAGFDIEGDFCKGYQECRQRYIDLVESNVNYLEADITAHDQQIHNAAIDAVLKIVNREIEIDESLIMTGLDQEIAMLKRMKLNIESLKRKAGEEHGSQG